MAINFDKVPSYIRREIDPPKKSLKQGSRGQKSQQVQEWLQHHECRTGIDGQYGPATAACVKDFQQKKGLRVSGIVDKLTWNSLLEPMTTALSAPSISSGDTAQTTVGQVVLQHLNQYPHEIGGQNKGPWVRLYCEGNEWPWCAGFVSLVMQQAFFYRQETAPIKGNVSCDRIRDQAVNKGLFVSESKIKSEQVLWGEFGGSCIFLRRRTSDDWTHAGIATTATGRGKNIVFHTIEGNTNDEGSREGYEACERKRSFTNKHYDFVSFVPIT